MLYEVITGKTGAVVVVRPRIPAADAVVLVARSRSAQRYAAPTGAGIAAGSGAAIGVGRAGLPIERTAAFSLGRAVAIDRTGAAGGEAGSAIAATCQRVDRAGSTGAIRVLVAGVAYSYNFV